MVHLLLARKVDPDAPTLFYIGNIAPDAVSEWNAFQGHRGQDGYHQRSGPAS